jgi:hypothetical protein
MQLGRLEEMEHAQLKHIEKITKITNVKAQDNILPEERYKDQESSINKNKKNEVLLDNVKFGFNKVTNEFFVRVIKDGFEYQFPTEEIMRLKEHFKEDLKDMQLGKNN